MSMHCGSLTASRLHDVHKGPATYDSLPPTKIILPDLVSHCSDFPLRINCHRKRVTVETKQWIFAGGNIVGPAIKKRYHGLNASLLAAATYPNCAHPQLRAASDFLAYLFHLDDLSDVMHSDCTVTTADAILNSLYHPHSWNNPAKVGKMAGDLFKRIMLTASPGTQQRFIETFDFFFQTVTEQATQRARGVIPDLESYIDLRRDNSACKPCFVLIEYVNNLWIPDEVMEHPLIRSLGEAANDVTTWSNDIFSFNVEQSRGETHNMITVVMHERGLLLQAAVDLVGDMCNSAIDRFREDRKLLPETWGFGPKVDSDVHTYVQGLESWIVGSLHWSFESERYFGTSGKLIRTTRVVHLLPRKDKT